MNIIGVLICAIKGHIVNPDESITSFVTDKRDWLCRCHRCGLYIMHDGAISNQTICLSEKEAKKTAMKIEQTIMELRRAVMVCQEGEDHD